MNSIPLILNLSLRIILLVTAVGMGIAFLFAGARMALAASLRPAVTITGDVLTVGDLFDGLDEKKASTVLGPAPQPGRDMTLNAQTLLRVALALDLPWRPSSAADQIVVSRSVTKIGEETVTSLIEEGLKAKGLSGNFNLVYSSGKPEMILPPSQPATAEIHSLRYDPQRGTFEAVLSAPSAATQIAALTVTGRVQRMVSMPVLKNTLRAGDIIGHSDIDWIEMEENGLAPDIIVNEDKLANMTPRRVIAAGRPIRAADLLPPQLVERGDTVTLVFADGPMLLTAQGKALQNGAKGDLIRVVNLASNRSIEGLVSADREITVTP